VTDEWEKSSRMEYLKLGEALTDAGYVVRYAPVEGKDCFVFTLEGAGFDAQYLENSYLQFYVEWDAEVDRFLYWRKNMCTSEETISEIIELLEGYKKEKKLNVPDGADLYDALEAAGFDYDSKWHKEGGFWRIIVRLPDVEEEIFHFRATILGSEYRLGSGLAWTKGTLDDFINCISYFEYPDLITQDDIHEALTDAGYSFTMLFVPDENYWTLTLKHEFLSDGLVVQLMLCGKYVLHCRDNQMPYIESTLVDFIKYLNGFKIIVGQKATMIMYDETAEVVEIPVVTSDKSNDVYCENLRELADAKKVTMTKKQAEAYGFDGVTPGVLGESPKAVEQAINTIKTLNEGRKDDNGKLRYDLVPKGTWAKVVAVITFGAGKYGDENWHMVVEKNPEKYYAAALRHVEAWWDGEKNDPESGEHHLAHAICCALFLMWADLEKE